MARAYNSFARLGDGIYRFTRAAPHAARTTGPHVTILGGIHGNERIGVLVLDALRLALLHASGNTAPLIADGASITLVYANQQALRIGKRGATPHADMNRCFTRESLSGSGALYEEIRARELAPLLATSDVMVDLHSTNKPSAPFVRIAGHANGLSQSIARIAARLPCSILLHDPKYLLADGCVALTDEYVGAHGGLGVCFESGVATDLSNEKVERITRSIWEILVRDTRAIEVVEEAAVVDRNNGAEELCFEEVFEITQVFKLTHAGFRWAQGVGDANFQRVAAQQPIGYVGDQPFAVDYESFVVFPKIRELWKLDHSVGSPRRRVRGSSVLAAGPPTVSISQSVVIERDAATAPLHTTR